MFDCVSYQVENIHKQFNSKISSMNEELCALQLVRIKTIKDKWELNIHNVNKSNSWQFKYQLFTLFKVYCIQVKSRKNLNNWTITL